MNRSHVIRLNATPEQEVYFRKACGVARHAYNWALARWKEARAEGKRVKMKDLKAAYNKIKGEQFPWCYEVTKCAPEQEFSHLGQTFALPNRDPLNSGPISAADYTSWKSHFGMSGSGAASASTGVPEPASLLLLLIGSTALLLRMRIVAPKDRR